MKPGKTIHKCEYYEGVILDVTYNKFSKKFSCRRCGRTLKDSQVDDRVLRTERRGK